MLGVFVLTFGVTSPGIVVGTPGMLTPGILTLGTVTVTATPSVEKTVVSPLIVGVGMVTTGTVTLWTLGTLETLPPQRLRNVWTWLASCVSPLDS
jgi:hypothetical protein